MARYVLSAQIKLRPPQNVNDVVNTIRNQLKGIKATVDIVVPPQAKKDLVAVQKSIKNVDKEAKQTRETIKSFGESVALAGKRFLAFSVATAGIFKLFGAIKTGISDAITFERELIKVSQATGSSVSGLASLTTEITRLSTKFGVASSKMIEVSRILSQAGLSANDVRLSLQALAKSDLAPTFDNIINTTEGAIAIFSQFQISARDLEKSLGSINAVAAKFAVESSDIITTVRRTGGAFAAAGGNLNELLALFTSVRATTRESAESIATGFRTIFTRLQRVRTQDFLANLGVNLRDLEGQFVGPYEAIRRLSTAMKNLRGTDPRFAQIIEELGGFRQVSKVIPLIQQFEIAERARGVAIAGTTSLTVDANTAQRALAVQIQKTREQFAAMIRNFTNTESFRKGIELALALASAFIKIADALAPLLPMLTILASVGIGKSIRPFVQGIKEKGGFGFGFGYGPGAGYATGGLVPGVGNRDTVPAKLMPGEFVLRKSAVQKIGPENLQYLNTGGPAYGGIFLQGTAARAGRGNRDIKDTGISGNKFAKDIAIGLSNVGKSLDEYDLLYNNRPLEELPGWGTNNVLVKAHYGYMSRGPRGDFVNVVNKGAKAMYQAAAENLSGGAIQIVNSDYINGADAVEGYAFEGAITRLGKPFDINSGMNDQNRPMDFPGGLPPALVPKFENSQNLVGIPIDAKRSEQQKDEIKPKFINDLSRALGSGQSYHGFSLRKKEVQQAAKGGLMSSVNAMLTPGEVVIGKEDVNRIGLGNLNMMNRSGRLPGFATGGAFKPLLTTRGKAPGNVGRYKQYLSQRLAFLKQGQSSNVLNEAELAELLKLQAKMNFVQSSRTARFSRRLGFAKGGLVGRNYASGGRVKRYATGGVAKKLDLAGAGFAAAGIAGLVSSFDNLSDGTRDLLNNFVSVGSQLGLLLVTLRTTNSAFGKYAEKTEAAQARIDTAKQQQVTTAEQKKLASENIAILRDQKKKTVVAERAYQQILQNKLGRITVERNRLGSTAAYLNTPAYLQNVAKEQAVKNAYTKSQFRINESKEALRVGGMQLKTLTEFEDKLKKTIDTEQKAIDRNEKMAKYADKAAIGLSVFTTALYTVGGILEKQGRADIERGGKGRDLVTGRSLSAAGLGAGIGASLGSILGPLGLLIGGLGGAAIGGVAGYSQGEKERFNLTSLKKFNDTLEQVNIRFKALVNNTTDVNSQRVGIQKYINDTQKLLQQKSISEESRLDITSNLKTQLDSLTTYLNLTANSSKTFGEFIDKAGLSVFNLVADLSNVSRGDLRQQYQDMIKSTQDTIKRTKELNILQDEYSNRMNILIDVSRSFEDVTISMIESTQHLDTVFGLLTNNISNIKLADFSDVIGSPEKFFDNRRFQSVLTRDITKNPLLDFTLAGQTKTVSQSLSSDLSAASQVSKDIPGVLLRLRNSIGEFTEENAINKLLKEFKDYPQFIRDAIEITANDIIGDEGKEEKLIERIRNDFSGVVKEMTEGFKPTFELAAKISKAQNEELNRRLEFNNKYIDTISKEIESRSKIIDQNIEAEKILASANNRLPNIGVLSGADVARQRAILGSFGGLANDPRAIGNKLEEERNKLIENQNRLSNESFDIDGKTNEAIRKNQEAVLRLTSALEFLADVGSRTAVTMEKVEREQSKIKFRTDLLDKVLSIGSLDESRKLGLELRSTRVGVATGDINTILPEFRSGVISLLKDLPQDETFGFLGGKTPKEALQKFRETLAQQIGFNKTDAEKLAKGTTSELDRLRTEISTIINMSDASNKIIFQNIKSLQSQLISDLNNSINTFTEVLRDSIRQQEEQQNFNKRNELRGTRENISTSLYNFQNMAARFGESRAKTIGQNLPEISSLYKAMQDKSKFSDLSSKLNAYTKYGGYEGIIRPKEIGEKLSSFQEQLVNVINIADLPLNINKTDAKLLSNKVRNFVGSFVNNDKDILDTFDKSIEDTLKYDIKNKATRGDFVTSIDIAFEQINSLIKSRISGLDDLKKELNIKFGDKPLSIDEINELGYNIKQYNEVFKTFAESDSIYNLQSEFDTLTSKISTLNSELAHRDLQNIISRASDYKVGSKPVPLLRQQGGLIKFAKGGVVPGRGNKDNVPALLTPGEVILPKMANGGSVLDEIRKRKRERYLASKASRKSAYNRGKTTTTRDIAPTTANVRAMQQSDRLAFIDAYEANPNITLPQFKAQKFARQGVKPKIMPPTQESDVARQRFNGRTDVQVQLKALDDKLAARNIEYQNKRQSRELTSYLLSSESKSVDMMPGYTMPKVTGDPDLKKRIADAAEREAKLRGQGSQYTPRSSLRDVQNIVNKNATNEISSAELTIDNLNKRFAKDIVNGATDEVTVKYVQALRGIKNNFKYGDVTTPTSLDLYAAGIGSTKLPELSFKDRMAYEMDKVFNISRLSKLIMHDYEVYNTAKKLQHRGKYSGLTDVNDVLKKLKGLRKNSYKSGSFISGSGSGDKVPAMLEPGEFVLNRNAVKAAGASNLHKFNKQYGRFQTGGQVNSQASVNIDISLLQSVVQNFSKVVDNFQNAANSLNGLEIVLNARHEVNVNIIGTSIFAQLQPSIQQLIVEETNKAINNFITTRLNNKVPKI